jgi:hypothetical protein
MPRVKLSKVLDRIESEIRYAMQDAFNSAGVKNADAGYVARAFTQALENRASTWIRVPDTAVSE